MTDEPTVSPEMYNQAYFTTECQGYEQFLETHGQTVPPRLQRALELAEVTPRMRVLDIGTGRGEVLVQCARRGADAHGVDYASTAVKLAAFAARTLPSTVPGSVHLAQSNAQGLPYAAGTFDRVFMLDLVEHLYPSELAQALQEARRVLKADGRLVIHTMPNMWYYRWGYPLYRLLQRLRGQRLPADPRARWTYVRHVHVNEQDPIRLRGALHRAGLTGRVWLESVQDYSYEGNRLIRAAMHFMTRVYPWRWIFCNDIFAVVSR